MDRVLRAEMVAAAREFVRAPVSYHWTQRELFALEPFFSNTDRKVFFIEYMPEAASTSLLAMYSRLKNPRGIRGNWVDSFLPSLLASLLDECAAMDGKQIQEWLKAKGATTLDRFCEATPQAQAIWQLLVDCTHQGSALLHRLALGDRIRQFLQMWLDAYGHNSIARTGKIVLCCEDFSLLTVKTLEWGRPGAGEIELSTRYVNVSKKGQYPFEREISLINPMVGELAAEVRDTAMDTYQELMGEKLDGPFPAFLRQKWQGVVSDSDLTSGVFGETCDVLGNLLPCSTLTSVGISMSAEAFPQHLKHLYLDGLPEGEALAEFISEEAQRIGLGSFVRHEQPTEWDRANWKYLDPIVPSTWFMAPANAYIEMLLARVFQEDSFSNVLGALAKVPRGEYDKLPSQFESVTANAWGIMSFRGWRDLQRQSFCAHLRGRVTPHLGFYVYPKPAPGELHYAFRMTHTGNKQLYRHMNEMGIPAALREYPMALGTNVPYYIAGNLRQWEFCNWQRSDFSVNDEVRQQFLAVEGHLREMYPWWPQLSRADTTPHYVFARGKTPVKLP